MPCLYEISCSLVYRVVTRVGWASTEYELDPQRSNARRIACDSGFEDPSSSSPSPGRAAGAVGTGEAGAMPRRGTLEDHSSESSVELAAIDVDVSDDTVESPKLPVSSDSDDGDGDGAGGRGPSWPAQGSSTTRSRAPGTSNRAGATSPQTTSSAHQGLPQRPSLRGRTALLRRRHRA